MAPHLQTPKKNRIKGAVEFATLKGLKISNTELALLFKVSRDQVAYALQSEDERTRRRSDLKRTNAQKLTERDLDRVELFLRENGPEGHQLSWAELLDQFGFEITPRTLRDRLAKRSVFTYIAVEKPYLDEKLATLRVQWAKRMLEKYPKATDWHHVRFSDEVHFGWGPDSRKLVIRHRGNGWRAHPDTIYRKETRPKNKKALSSSDTKRLHYWAAVGYNFKSPIVRYEIPSNSNGKMTQQVYVEAILEPHIAQWCLETNQWCLEEDNDSGHGLQGKDNLILRWKQAHGMSQNPSATHRWYANCPQSPDLAIIEDTWSYPKAYVRRRPHWDDELVDEMVREAWADLPQKWVNKLVNSMPQRLQDVITSGGQLVEMR